MLLSTSGRIPNNCGWVWVIVEVVYAERKKSTFFWSPEEADYIENHFGTWHRLVSHTNLWTWGNDMILI